MSASRHGRLLLAVIVASILLPGPVFAQRLVGPTLVVPLDGGNDPRAFWLGEATALLLADDLNYMGAEALTRDERVRAFERLQVPVRAILTRGTIIKIGQLVGAGTVISGTLALDGTGLGVHVEAIRIDTGRITADVEERGPLQDLLGTINRVAKRLFPTSMVPTADVERQHPPLAAFENFVKGLLAETPATQVSYLQKALVIAPQFDRARLALVDAHADIGEFDAARKDALMVRESSALYRDAQFAAALAELNLKRYDDAFARLQTLNTATPAAEVYNNIGIVQLRRGATPETGRATYFFNKAVELKPASPDYTFNLGYAYLAEQDHQAAIYWLREAVRRQPGDADAHFALAAALQATNARTEADRERELARRLSAGYEEAERPAGDAVPRGLERVHPFLDRPGASRTDTVLTTTEQRDQRELATFHLERGRRFYEREDDRNALAELERTIYLSPYQAEAHLLVGRLHLRAGRPREAIEALKISLWSEETPAAHLALGEAYLQVRDPAAAQQEAERALQMTPGLAEATRLLERARGLATAAPQSDRPRP